MLGLVNRSIEVFLRTTYGEKVWKEIAARADVDARGFNSLRHYADETTTRLLRCAATTLKKTTLEILEDTGSWMVRLEPIRRLLRFSGGEFAEFIDALEELPARARMALPDLVFPPLTVTQKEGGIYDVQGHGWPFGLQWIVAGVLRGMADDYGVLALIEADADGIEIRILEEEFALGRPFDLAPAPSESIAL
ncbi:heme NO-binding domain-containing protein [Paracoccus cavernae]